MTYPNEKRHWTFPVAFFILRSGPYGNVADAFPRYGLMALHRGSRGDLPYLLGHLRFCLGDISLHLVFNGGFL